MLCGRKRGILRRFPGGEVAMRVDEAVWLGVLTVAATVLRAAFSGLNGWCAGGIVLLLVAALALAAERKRK